MAAELLPRWSCSAPLLPISISLLCLSNNDFQSASCSSILSIQTKQYNCSVDISSSSSSSDGSPQGCGSNPLLHTLVGLTFKYHHELHFAYFVRLWDFAYGHHPWQKSYGVWLSKPRDYAIFVLLTQLSPPCFVTPSTKGWRYLVILLFTYDALYSYKRVSSV